MFQIKQPRLYRLALERAVAPITNAEGEEFKSVILSVYVEGQPAPIKLGVAFKEDETGRLEMSGEEWIAQLAQILGAINRAIQAPEPEAPLVRLN